MKNKFLKSLSCLFSISNIENDIELLIENIENIEDVKLLNVNNKNLSKFNFSYDSDKKILKGFIKENIDGTIVSSLCFEDLDKDFKSLLYNFYKYIINREDESFFCS